VFSVVLFYSCSSKEVEVSDSADSGIRCVEPLTTPDCPMTVCQRSCLELEQQLECCAHEFLGVPISEARALCVAHANGMQAGLSVCFAEQRLDHWSVKNVLSIGCDEATAAGGEVFAIDMEDGSLLGVGTWTADSFQECP